MAVPFFSIDLNQREWWAYASSLSLKRNSATVSEVALNRLLEERFPEHHVCLLPSARIGFYFLLKRHFQAGDEVIFSAMSYPLYIKISLQLGLVPVLVDVEPLHLTIDVDKLRKTIGPKTKGIVVTHLFGHPCQMDELIEISESKGIPLIEDCAQSFDSFYRGKETGNFGYAGIFTTSLMKVPTTLGGGVLVTKEKDLYEEIQSQLQGGYYGASRVSTVSYHLKGLISMLNSSPWLYTILCHQVFGLLKKSNPSLLRAILYSGMGMGSKDFDFAERPPLARYQYKVGQIQFDRTREMTESRRENSNELNNALADLEKVTLFQESKESFWNYQYHVINFRSAIEMDRVYNKMFSRGIHVMKEDVWDCSSYGFSGLINTGCSIASGRTPGLLRIPNNSKLSKKTIELIASTLRGYCEQD